MELPHSPGEEKVEGLQASLPGSYSNRPASFRLERFDPSSEKQRPTQIYSTSSKCAFVSDIISSRAHAPAQLQEQALPARNLGPQLRLLDASPGHARPEVATDEQAPS